MKKKVKKKTGKKLRKNPWEKGQKIKKLSLKRRPKTLRKLIIKWQEPKKMREFSGKKWQECSI